MRKKFAALVSEPDLQTQQTNDEQALVLHAQLMDQYAEAFQKLENDTLGRLMSEDIAKRSVLRMPSNIMEISHALQTTNCDYSQRG